MFGSGTLRDELHALRNEMTRLMHAPAEDVPDADEHLGGIADDIRSILRELGNVLGKEEQHFERLVAERPLASLTSAFAAGIAIGFMLRRH